MADITMCKNEECPQLDNCWRAGMPPDADQQSYCCFEPELDDEDAFLCTFFIPYPE